MLFSLSKSFTSTAIGLAISEGLLIIDDPVIGFFSQEQLPSDISNELKEMTVRHLLTMISGHGQCALTGRQTAKFQGGGQAYPRSTCGALAWDTSCIQFWRDTFAVRNYLLCGWYPIAGLSGTAPFGPARNHRRKD